MGPWNGLIKVTPGVTRGTGDGLGSIHRLLTACMREGRLGHRSIPPCMSSSCRPPVLRCCCVVWLMANGEDFRPAELAHFFEILGCDLDYARGCVLCAGLRSSCVLSCCNACVNYLPTHSPPTSDFPTLTSYFFFFIISPLTLLHLLHLHSLLNIIVKK